MDIQGRRPADAGFSGPIPFEALAVAPYQSTWPMGSTLTNAQYDALTLEQVMDVNDAFIHHLRGSTYGQWAKGHRDALSASSRPTTKLISYEGGLKRFGLGGTEPAASMRTVAASLHPRIRAQMLMHLTMLDELGMLIYTQNTLAAVFGTEGTIQIGGPYIGLTQIPGTGDGSDGLPDNRPYLSDPSTGRVIAAVDLAPGGVPLVSPYGLAIAQWNTGLQPSLEMPKRASAAMAMGMC